MFIKGLFYSIVEIRRQKFSCFCGATILLYTQYFLTAEINVPGLLSCYKSSCVWWNFA